jgi:Cu(I)/Ag(I) efflux system membrane protein CusA/SilA
MWSIGTGSDVMKRIAAPMVGGIFTSFILELLVYPVVYELWKRKTIAEPFNALGSEERQSEPELAFSAGQD